MLEGGCLAVRQGFAFAAAKPAEPMRLEVRNPGATPSVNRRIEMQPFNRQAGVGLSAFTHRFPPSRAASADRTLAVRSVSARVVQEGGSDPFLHPADELRSEQLVAEPIRFLPMPFGLRSGCPLDPPG